MWLALSNGVLTWELLQKRQVQGPSYCIFCKNCEETILHLAIFCPFTHQMFLKTNKTHGLGNVWSMDSIEAGAQGAQSHSSTCTLEHMVSS